MVVKITGHTEICKDSKLDFSGHTSPLMETDKVVFTATFAVVNCLGTSKTTITISHNSK